MRRILALIEMDIRAWVRAIAAADPVTRLPASCAES
jgi:hypothetical protein